MAHDFLISVVVATYNRPQALNLVLQSLLLQQDKNFEVVVADDGQARQALVGEVVVEPELHALGPVLLHRGQSV